MAIEEALDIEISDEDVNVASIEDLLTMIAGKLGINPHDPIESSLKVLVDPLHNAIFPKQSTPTTPAVDSTLVYNIVRYLKSLNKRYRRSYPRTIKQIQSALRVRGLTSTQIMQAVKSDARLKTASLNKHVSKITVEIA